MPVGGRGEIRREPTSRVDRGEGNAGRRWGVWGGKQGARGLTEMEASQRLAAESAVGPAQPSERGDGRTRPAGRRRWARSEAALQPRIPRGPPFRVERPVPGRGLRLARTLLVFAHALAGFPSLASCT